MSHQVNCYLDPVDTEALEAALRAGDELRVLHSRSSSASPRVVPSVTLEENGTPWLHFHFVRAADLDQVVMRQEPGEDFWTVDAVRSPVIELHRSFYDGTILRRGRLSFDDSFRGEDEKWVKKPQAFKEWAMAALKKAKKMMLRHEGEYVGTHAQSWLEQWHGQLVV